MIMESIERAESGNPRYINGGVENLKEAVKLAYAGVGDFKLYTLGGHFLAEYALFDGKYRQVVGAKEIHIAI